MLEPSRLDCRVEYVTTAWHGLHHSMPIVIERLPDLRNALRQRIIGDERVRPDGADELLFGNQSTVSFDQEHEHSECLASDAHFLSSSEQATAVEVEHDLAGGVRPMRQHSRSSRCRGANRSNA